MIARDGAKAVENMGRVFGRNEKGRKRHDAAAHTSRFIAI
jgi:hypothetical protein